MAIPATDSSTQAKFVLEELRRGGVIVPGDALAVLAVYVEECYEELEAETGLNPRATLSELAARAARSYAKFKYTGANKDAVQAEKDKRAWRGRAQAKHLRAVIAAEREAEEKEKRWW